MPAMALMTLQGARHAGARRRQQEESRGSVIRDLFLMATDGLGEKCLSILNGIRLQNSSWRLVKVCPRKRELKKKIQIPNKKKIMKWRFNFQLTGKATSSSGFLCRSANHKLPFITIHELIHFQLFGPTHFGLKLILQRAKKCKYQKGPKEFAEWGMLCHVWL